MTDDESAQDGLNFRYTTMFRIWRELADQKTSACCKEHLSTVSSLSHTSHSETYREQHKKDVLYDISPARTTNSHCGTPRVPVMACVLRFVAPTAKALVQVELAITIHIVTVSSLEIGQPIACDIYECCDCYAQDARSDQDDPDLTCICQLLYMPQHTTGTSIKVA